MSEEIYTPEQCIFAFINGQISINTLQCWEKERCLSDQIGGHCFPDGLLESCGVCAYEDCEGIFSLIESENIVKQLMIAAGFTFNPQFQEFLEETN